MDILIIAILKDIQYYSGLYKPCFFYFIKITNHIEANRLLYDKILLEVISYVSILHNTIRYDIISFDINA